MKKIFLLLPLIQVSLFSYSQMEAKVEMKEKIEGICNAKNDYSLFSMFGDQKEAICSISDSIIEERLNREVEFLKDKPKYKDKGMVSIFINCKGEAVQCKIGNKTRSSVLDEQVVNIFKTLASWKAGKLNGKDVDSLRLWSFEINNGKLTLQ